VPSAAHVSGETDDRKRLRHFRYHADARKVAEFTSVPVTGNP
jgi:hypothetical protein